MLVCFLYIKKKAMIKNYKTINFIIFFIVVMFVFDSFTNTYILLRDNYDKRMTSHLGYCDNQGYGFYKKIYEKFSKNNQNLIAINFNDAPSPDAYFFNYNKKNQLNSFVLIGANKKVIEDYKIKKFKIILNENNCYFIKK